MNNFKKFINEATAEIFDKKAKNVLFKEYEKRSGNPGSYLCVVNGYGLCSLEYDDDGKVYINSKSSIAREYDKKKFDSMDKAKRFCVDTFKDSIVKK